MKKILIGLLAFIIILSLGAVIYFNDYYEASGYVHALMEENSSRITTEGQYTSIRPKEVFDEPIGMIFYPGGKVEAIAYMPLLMQLADQGVRPVLVEMQGIWQCWILMQQKMFLACIKRLNIGTLQGIPLEVLWQANIWRKIMIRWRA